MNVAKIKEISSDVPHPSDTGEMCSNSVIIQPSCTTITEVLITGTLQYAGVQPSTSKTPGEDKDLPSMIGYSLESLVDKNYAYCMKLPRPYHCTEVGCDKSYVTASNLKRHINVVHLQMKPCSKCGALMELIATSEQRDASGIVICVKRLYKCIPCLISVGVFHQEKGGRAQKTKGLFSCDQCFFKFVALRDLNRHYRGHTIYKCSYSQCSALVFSGMAIKKHYAVDHKDYLMGCDNCSKTFESKGALREHVLTHLNAEVRAYFDCPFKNKGCKRKYLYKRNLKQHIDHAHNRVVFKCRKCNKGLSTKQKLKLHVGNKHKQNGKENHPRLVVSRPTMIHKLLGVRQLKVVGGKTKKSSAKTLKTEEVVQNWDEMDSDDDTLPVETSKTLKDVFKTQSPGVVMDVVESLLNNNETKDKNNFDECDEFFSQPFMQMLY